MPESFLVVFVISSMVCMLLNRLTYHSDYFKQVQQLTVTSGTVEGEVVIPKVELIANSSVKEFFVYFDVSSVHYKLHLQLNEGLLSPRFSSVYHDHNGVNYIQGHENCFYHGKVIGQQNWTAVLSTCSGIRGYFGPREDPSNQYYIKPLHKNAGPSNFNMPHLLYRSRPHKAENGTCGTKGSSFAHVKSQHVWNHNLKRQSYGTVVEWTIVNDHAQFIAFQRNLTLAVLRAIEIANGVDQVFKVLGIRIVVVDVVTWTINDQIHISRNAGDFLKSFRDYSSNLPQQYDTAMLFSGTVLEGATIGIAYTGTICKHVESAVGLVQDGGEELNSIVSTTSHELGHIFAMDHDGEKCICTGEPSGTCIMHDVIRNPPPTTWSSCSVETLQNSLAGELGHCLHNRPEASVTDYTCGNGLLDEGEVCDCGSAKECIDKCCNYTTCQLIVGAQCRMGSCCQDCRYKEYGTICRPGKNECDIGEYCLGNDVDCPTDYSMQDYSPCQGNQSHYCYSGLCMSRDGVCQKHFGTNDGVDECYTSVNTEGTRHGHCGFDGSQYIPCLEKNAFCGQVQCEDGGILHTTSGELVRTILHSPSYICNTVTSRAGTDNISPGLMPDGTRCGDEKVCVRSACVNVTSVRNTTCLEESGNCSGNGVCNNINLCSCFVGYTGKYCNEAVGIGKQIGVNNGVIAAGVIGTFVMVYTLIVLGVFIFHLVLRSKSTSKSKQTRVHDRSTRLDQSQSATQPTLSESRRKYPHMPSTHPVRLAVAPIRPTLQFSGVGESDTSVSAEKQRPPRPPRTNNNIPLGVRGQTQESSRH